MLENCLKALLDWSRAETGARMLKTNKKNVVNYPLPAPAWLAVSSTAPGQTPCQKYDQIFPQI